MTTPSVGPIAFSDINTELGRASNTAMTLNDADVRALAGPAFATPGTLISLNDLRGKSSFSATGGTVTSSGITPGNGYRYHVFTAPGNFTVTGSKTVEYLVVAGGASGGGHYGGGGGAGGVLSGSTTVSTGSYSISIGSGGSPSQGYTTPNAIGKNGGNSSFGAITATGGGGGAARGWPGAASPGGSGGGGTVFANPGVGGSGTPGQGNPGGSATAPGNGGAGGGGRGGAGQSGGSPRAGGVGSPFPAFAAPLISPQIPTGAPWVSAVGPTGLYGGGGGGGDQDNPGGTGGPGGGGTGGGPYTTPGFSAVNYTGGGGGGAAQSEQGSFSGSGGNGLVVIRYPI